MNMPPVYRNLKSFYSTDYLTEYSTTAYLQHTVVSYPGNLARQTSERSISFNFLNPLPPSVLRVFRDNSTYLTSYTSYLFLFPSFLPLHYLTLPSSVLLYSIVEGAFRANYIFYIPFLHSFLPFFHLLLKLPILPRGPSLA